MSFLSRHKGRTIPPNAAFRITQEGRDKLQQFPGDEKSRVLIQLESSGSMDVDEISRATGISVGKLENLMPALMRGGYVQISSAPLGGDFD